MSVGLPSVSPVTPEDSEDRSRSMALSTGAYMEEDEAASQETEQEDRTKGNGFHASVRCRKIFVSIFTACLGSGIVLVHLVSLSQAVCLILGQGYLQHHPGEETREHLYNT